MMGCSKMLDKQPLDAASTTTYWKTEADAEQAVNNCYRSLTDIDNDIFLSSATDDSYAWSGWPLDIAGAANGSATATLGTFDHYWSHSYQAIAAANNVLDNMDKIPASAIDETIRKRLKGEARFIRAYFYQQLTGFYGDVPLITHIQSPSEFDAPKTPKDSVALFVVSEIDDFANDLPLSYDASNLGRVTQGAALALKARVLLYEGKWPEAAAASQAVMNLGIYNIEQGGYLSLFDGTNKSSKEIILAGQYIKDVYASGVTTWVGGPSLGGWSEIAPLQRLVDDYECTDGKTIDQSPLYNASTPYNNRDNRLTLTVAVPGTVINGTTIDVTAPNSIDGLGKNNASFTGYYFKKYIPADVGANWWSNSYNDEILIRYAEVLLTYAEAKIEANDIDASVYDAINQIRQRTGVNQPAVTPADYATQADLRTLVRRERHVEFAVEPQRLFDIRRWKTAEIVMPGNAYGILNNFDPTRSDYGQHILVESRNFDPARDYLWAIPQNELDLNKNLTQNTSW